MAILKEKIFKVGENRGKKRIWIEGKFLLDAKLNRGWRFDKQSYSNDENGIEKRYMMLTPNKNGQHMIAGSDTRPIIDLNGKYLNDLFDGFSHYKVEIFLTSDNKRHITIEGCDND